MNSVEQTSVQIIAQHARSGKRNAFLALRVQRSLLQESMTVLLNYDVVGAKHNSHSQPKSSELKFNVPLVSEAYV